MNVRELDDLVSSAGLPVRPETLAEAWDSMSEAEGRALPAGQVLAVISLQTKVGMDQVFREAAQAFINASSAAPGALSSTLHRSSVDPGTWFLVERFTSERAFGLHMASDYFRAFQDAQTTLLAEPVRAVFLARGDQTI
jgi:quinol monooxygenase YgiN